MLSRRNRHKTPNLGIDCTRTIIRNGKHNIRASIREAVHRKSREIRIKKLHFHITSKVSGPILWIIDYSNIRGIDLLNAADNLSILRLQNIFCSFLCLSRFHDYILTDFPNIGRSNIYTVGSGIPSNSSIQQLTNLSDREIICLTSHRISKCDAGRNLLPIRSSIALTGYNHLFAK